MNWLEYVQKNWKHMAICYMRTETPVRKSWGRPITRLPRLDGMKLWLPKNIREDAGYINLETHEVVYTDDATEYGRLGLDMMFKELTNIK